MGMARLAVVAMAVAVAVAQDEGSGVGLPAGHEDILSNPYDPESFSCEGQDYGYYADVASGCEIFHICLPIQDNDGLVTSTALSAIMPTMLFPAKNPPASLTPFPSERFLRT